MNIHLIAFNVPFPANYGGVIDVYYKIKALKKVGMKVHLHCFQYGRAESEELEKICERVFYYERKTNVFQQFSVLPYIVKSRKNLLLLKKLKEDTYPIIFEGLHCCGFLNTSELKNRLKIVRMHNVEWQYYEHLVREEKSFIKRLFFQIESWRLKRFEKQLKIDYLLTISPADTYYFKKALFNTKIAYIPAFHGNNEVKSKVGQGDYFLFHGDLSVVDNEKAALFLIEKVFNDLEIKLVIAGLNPSAKLLAKAKANIKIKANLPFVEMQNLIENAQANILISFHSAGMKLKLLNALFNGRFCIVNRAMIKGLDLEKIVFVEDNPSDLKQIVKEVSKQVFGKKEIDNRKVVLESDLNDVENAKKIRKLLIKAN